MKYALTLYEDSWSGNRLDLTSGKVVGYRVAGMPQGEEAHIANFGTLDQSEWRIIRSNSGTQGNWTGHYESAEAALDVLRKEFDLRSRGHVHQSATTSGGLSVDFV